MVIPFRFWQFSPPRFVLQSTPWTLDLKQRSSNLFAAVRSQLGVDGRDAVWGHPDLLPDGQDLDDPLGYTERRANPIELPPGDDER